MVTSKLLVTTYPSRLPKVKTLSSKTVLPRKFFIVFCFISLLLIIFSGIYLTPTILAANDNTASIKVANIAINRAYTNVLAAEQVGGNVTTLLNNLRNDSILISKSENFIRSGETGNVSLNIENAIRIADQVNRDAITLRSSSLVESQFTFWSNYNFLNGWRYNVLFGLMANMALV